MIYQIKRFIKKSEEINPRILHDAIKWAVKFVQIISHHPLAFQFLLVWQFLSKIMIIVVQILCVTLSKSINKRM